MNIVLVGHVCIDINSSEHASYTNWGSGLMYMSHYLQQQLQINPALVAPYGEDFAHYAAEVRLLPPPNSQHTLVYRNHTDNHNQGEQRTWQCEHTEATQPVILTNDISAALAAADIICVAPLLPNIPVDYVRELFAQTSTDCIKVLAPQGYMRSVDPDGNVVAQDFVEAADIIPLFDMVILSEDDHPDALGMTQRWAQMSEETQLIVTQGSNGASLITTESITPVPTNPVPADQVVDSVGCGDTFTVAAMCSYYDNPDIFAAMQAGNLAARDKLFHSGITPLTV